MGVPKTITFRVTQELRAEIETEIDALAPYGPSISAVVERGVILALTEMRQRRQKDQPHEG